MTVDIDKTTIETYQGDTCSVTLTGLEEGMVIYFGVREITTNEPVFDEIRGIVDSEGEVTVTMTPETTNDFNVTPSAGVKAYYYGAKQVDESTGEENTILLGNDSKVGDKYYLKVYLKKVEGLIEDNV
jgi:hypothetical protein